MAAKTAGTWAVTSPVGINNALADHSTTQLHPLGTRCKAVDRGTTDYGEGEFVYLKGVASTVRGSVVLVKDDYSTSLVAARDKGALAVALAATVANEYGWYQILGKGVAACGTIAANAPLYIAAAGAIVDDAAVAGDQIIGMRSVTADDTSTAVVNMACHPATADFDNA